MNTAVGSLICQRPGLKKCFKMAVVSSFEAIEYIRNLINSALYLLLPYPSTMQLLTDLEERLICYASSNCSNLGKVKLIV